MMRKNHITACVNCVAYESVSPASPPLSVPASQSTDATTEPVTKERAVGVVDARGGGGDETALGAKGAHHRRARHRLGEEGEERRLGKRFESLELACGRAVEAVDGVGGGGGDGDGGGDEQLRGGLARAERAHHGNGEHVERNNERVLELRRHLLVDGRHVRREAVEDAAEGRRLEPADARAQHRVRHARGHRDEGGARADVEHERHGLVAAAGRHRVDPHLERHRLQRRERREGETHAQEKESEA
eukprot:1319724-Pleurochrysis_carterae.AAC.2